MLGWLRSDGWRHVILSNHVPELPALVERLALNPHDGCRHAPDLTTVPAILAETER
jgi:hypothetical protein